MKFSLFYMWYIIWIELHAGGAQEETYMVVEVAENGAQQGCHKLEDVEFSRALFELYEGGVVRYKG